MTLTLVGADVRGFYDALGVELPGWAHTNAPARCFADPDAHRRGDRDPSVSVNLITGAWNCHGCGHSGGAYDAAIATGHSARSAIDLMIDHGLIERRARLTTAAELATARINSPRPSTKQRRARAVLTITEPDVRRYADQLARRPEITNRLNQQRAWTAAAIAELQLGYDRGRITIPIRDANGGLQGLLRYQPEPSSRPKMLAVPGTRLGLVPHPAVEPSERILLVEGPPDMIAARSHDLPAIAVPGDHSWQHGWTQLLAGRHITIIMDADDQGRAAAQRIAHELAGIADPQILDLAPDRNDGYDLTDRLLNGDGPGRGWV